MSETTHKMLPCTMKVLDERRVGTVASTGALDREWDRIIDTAWNLVNYRASGAPVLWSHDYKSPPIARSVDVRVVNGQLRTIDEFPPRGIYPLADQILDLVKGGFIVAKSVGFRPLEWRANPEGGRDFTKVELLEHSYVSVPANPEAVVTAKAQGVRDPVALSKFFGLGDRLALGDDDPRLAVDAATVAAGVRAYIEREVAREVRLQAILAHLPVDHVGDHVVLDSGEIVTAAALKSALHTALGQVVSREVRSAVNRIAGRID